MEGQGTHDLWHSLFVCKGQRFLEGWGDFSRLKKCAYWAIGGAAPLAFAASMAAIGISRMPQPKNGGVGAAADAAKRCDTAKTLGIDRKAFPTGPMKPVRRTRYAPPARLQKQN